jgi:RNA recognition motif-containing protein
MRLYVGGLPYETNEQELTRLFEQVGTVTDARVITDRESGYSKGFGFVEMSSPQEGQSAIERLNGTTLGTRTIIVNQARERQYTGNSQRHYNNDSSRY